MTKTIIFIGKEKQSLTLIAAGCMDGSLLPTTIILPGKGIKKLRCDLPENIYVLYSGTDKSWVNSDILSRWISLVVARYARKIPLGKRGLIIADNHTVMEKMY